MGAGLFIYFPRDPGHNIYFKVSTESTVRPLTKKGISFNHSPIVPTAILNTSNLLRATMDAGLFIYFPRDAGHNIYYKVFDDQDIYFKNPPPPNQLYVP